MAWLELVTLKTKFYNKFSQCTREEFALRRPIPSGHLWTSSEHLLDTLLSSEHGLGKPWTTSGHLYGPLWMQSSQRSFLRLGRLFSMVINTEGIGGLMADYFGDPYPQ